MHGIPHVVTAHSLEPRRPWKADQLGGGYRLSSWVERTAYLAADAVIAVSHGMRADVLDAYPDLDPARSTSSATASTPRPTGRSTPPTSSAALGVDPDRPYALFVGRITRQKGVMHLLAAAEQLPPEAGLVLCAGAADTPAERQQVADAVAELQARRGGVVWIEEMLPREQLVPLITGATVFVVPSVYEPLGIVNLEAAACGTAVVASDVGRHPGGRRRRPHRPAGALRPRRRRRLRGAGSPRGSPSCSPIRTGPRRWAPPGGSGCWPSSAGRRSPSRRSRCTPRCSPPGLTRPLVLSAADPVPAAQRQRSRCESRRCPATVMVTR